MVFRTTSKGNLCRQACYGIPICSMYGIFTYIWLIFKADVGKYSIHGAYGTTIMYIIFYTIIPLSLSLSLSPVFSRRSRQTRREMNFPSGNQTWQWEIPYQSKVRIGRPSMNGYVPVPCLMTGWKMMETCLFPGWYVTTEWWLGNHPQMAANVSAIFTWVD